jgi:Zn-dependent metalloprotease
MKRIRPGGVVLAAAALVWAAPVTGALATGPASATMPIGAAQAQESPGADRSSPVLSSSELERFVVRDRIVDPDGGEHVRYDRRYAGLPVVGGDVVVHKDAAGRIRDVDRASEASLALSGTVPRTSGQRARDAAVRHAVADQITVDGLSCRLAVMADLSTVRTPTLVWETVVTGVRADGTPSRLHVFTDARSDQVIDAREDIHTGVGEGVRNGRVTLDTTPTDDGYQLVDPGRGTHAVRDLRGGTSGTGALFADSDDVWGDGTPASRQSAAVDAAYGAAVTWDFLQKELGRKGIRDDGRAPTSKVHYGKFYANAFWDDADFSVSYGDGPTDDGPMTALDVVAHEMGHGLTAATARLAYSGESGGLNEATSDILATSAEFFAGNPSDPGDYRIGEKLDYYGDGSPVRYMDMPSLDGISKDYWSPQLKNMGVHQSSGPANHFFYLLGEGSGSRTINGVEHISRSVDGSTVTGIGRGKAVRIWYHALTRYFTSATDYADARRATLQAACDLYGTESPEQRSVAEAWSAVNVTGQIFVPPTTTYFENLTRTTVSDPGSTTSTIKVEGIPGVEPKKMMVAVEIEHPSRGELQLDLRSPDGRVFRLKEADELDTVPDLRALYSITPSGCQANGVWTLIVQDVRVGNTGHLDQWALVF